MILIDYYNSQCYFQYRFLNNILYQNKSSLQLAKSAIKELFNDDMLYNIISRKNIFN